MGQDEVVAPRPLPAGTTLADIPDREVWDRAAYVADLFQDARDLVKQFIAEGYPAEESYELCVAALATLEFAASRLPGAREWHEKNEPGVGVAVKAGGLDGRVEDVPPIIPAVFWCEVALGAEEEFWAVVRAHEAKLKTLPGWVVLLRRLRAN
jgi:hypothetical protein